MEQASSGLAPDRLGRPPHCPGRQRASRRTHGPGSVAAPSGEPEASAQERLRRGERDGASAAAAGPAPAADPAKASAASPGRGGFLYPIFRPHFLGERPLRPARSTRSLLPAPGASSSDPSRNCWTMGLRMYELHFPV
jgi:hypothetical protein